MSMTEISLVATARVGWSINENDTIIAGLSYTMSRL